jgi:DNA-binding CsgD family transcriptional regulator
MARDPSGIIGYRAWLYSGDADGNEFRALDPLSVGSTVMPVRPTPPHALSHQDDGGREERILQAAQRLRAEAGLTDLELQVLRLGIEETYSVEIEIPSEEATKRGLHSLGQALDAGWLLVSGSRVTKDFRREALTYEQRAAILGLSVWQVHRLVKSARRKLRGA